MTKLTLNAASALMAAAAAAGAAARPPSDSPAAAAQFQLSPAAWSRLTKPASVVPPCDKQETVDIVWKDAKLSDEQLGNMTDPVSLRLTLAPMDSAAVGDTVVTHLNLAAGTLDIGGEPNHASWRIRQAHYSDMFAKAVFFKGSRLSIFLPASFTRAEGEAPIFNPLLLICAVGDDRLVSCTEAKFAFGEASRREHNSKRTLEEMASWSGPSSDSPQPQINLNGPCCMSSYRCKCSSSCNVTGGRCPWLCPNCDSQRGACRLCVDLGCDGSCL